MLSRVITQSVRRFTSVVPTARVESLEKYTAQNDLSLKDTDIHSITERI